MNYLTHISFLLGENSLKYSIDYMMHTGFQIQNSIDLNNALNSLCKKNNKTIFTDSLYLRLPLINRKPLC